MLFTAQYDQSQCMAALAFDNHAFINHQEIKTTRWGKKMSHGCVVDDIIDVVLWKKMSQAAGEVRVVLQ